MAYYNHSKMYKIPITNNNTKYINETYKLIIDKEIHRLEKDFGFWKQNKKVKMKTDEYLIVLDIFLLTQSIFRLSFCSLLEIPFQITLFL